MIWVGRQKVLILLVATCQGLRCPFGVSFGWTPFFGSAHLAGRGVWGVEKFFQRLKKNLFSNIDFLFKLQFTACII